MDSFGFGDLVIRMSNSSVLNNGTVETFLCTFVALVVLRLELQRRGGDGPNVGSRETCSYAESCKRLLRNCAPEAACLIAVLSLVALLRARGDSEIAAMVPEEAQVWEEIKSEWPLLMTADTLLSIQAMLRFVVLISVVLRAGDGKPIPLADEAAVLWLGAAFARVATHSMSQAYMLEGPVGGIPPLACEVAVLPMLLVLSRGTLRRMPLTISLVFAASAAFAFRNRLALGGHEQVDGLFVLAHCLDTLAAVAYLLRTLLIEDSHVDVSVTFTHILMPIQAALSAYFFLQAMPYSVGMVAAGAPFAVLHIGTTVQLGAYLAAAALHLAEWSEGLRSPVGSSTI